MIIFKAVFIIRGTRHKTVPKRQSGPKLTFLFSWGQDVSVYTLSALLHRSYRSFFVKFCSSSPSQIELIKESVSVCTCIIQSFCSHLIIVFTFIMKCVFKYCDFLDHEIDHFIAGVAFHVKLFLF